MRLTRISKHNLRLFHKVFNFFPAVSTITMSTSAKPTPAENEEILQKFVLPKRYQGSEKSVW